MEEIWKDIKGYEGYYKISNFGRVKRMKRITKFNDGRLYKYNEKIVNINKGKIGYFVVDLYKNTKRMTFYIHRLVAEAFIPNPDNLPQVNHRDGNKLNNDIDNLEWVSAKQNCQHAYDNNLHTNNKKVLQYDLNGNLIKEWNSIQKAQKCLNLNHIWDVCIGKRNKCGNYIWKYSNEIKD